MENIKIAGYRCVSVEMFNTFFSLERKITQDIVNTLLDGSYVVREIEEMSVDENIFGFYHPYIVLDALSSVGRCMMILTPLDNSTKEVKDPLVGYMLNRECAKKRNIFPLVMVFDSSESSALSRPVSISLMKGESCTFALCRVKMEGGKEGTARDVLISDLMCTKSCEIKSYDIRRVYDLSYKKSGLEEMERVSYAMWLEAVKKDIQKLGLNPGAIIK